MENSTKMKKWKRFDFGSDNKPTAMRQNANGSTPEATICDLSNFTVKGTKTFSFERSIAPKTPSDLAVHPKKVQELEEWLRAQITKEQKSLPILLMTGPSGSGKQTALKVICRSLGISVSEWINPVDQEYEYTRQNQVSQFTEFLIDSKYKSLFDSKNKSITLVKDFPNAIVRQPTQFFDILEELSFKITKPIAFLCTDSGSLVRSLFPDEIINQYNIRHICVNACAPSLLKNAIKRAQALVKQNPDLFREPASSTVEAIIATSMGDIRTAMNQFHMASLINSGDLPTVKTMPITGGKRKRKTAEVKVRGMEKDENLGLFHGLGRVLNPKWTEDDNPKRLNCDVEKLISEFSLAPNMFSSFLFENYPKYFGDLTDASEAAECLSIAAMFLDYFGEKDEILQYTLWISVLGLMVANSHRVSKWNQIRGPTKVTKRLDKNVALMGFDSSDIFYHNIITSKSVLGLKFI